VFIETESLITMTTCLRLERLVIGMDVLLVGWVGGNADALWKTG